EVGRVAVHRGQGRLDQGAGVVEFAEGGDRQLDLAVIDGHGQVLVQAPLDAGERGEPGEVADRGERADDLAGGVADDQDAMVVEDVEVQADAAGGGAVDLGNGDLERHLLAAGDLEHVDDARAAGDLVVLQRRGQDAVHRGQFALAELVERDS